MPSKIIAEPKTCLDHLVNQETYKALRATLETDYGITDQTLLGHVDTLRKGCTKAAADSVHAYQADKKLANSPVVSFNGGSFDVNTASGEPEFTPEAPVDAGQIPAVAAPPPSPVPANDPGHNPAPTPTPALADPAKPEPQVFH